MKVSYVLRVTRRGLWSARVAVIRKTGKGKRAREKRIARGRVWVSHSRGPDALRAAVAEWGMPHVRKDQKRRGVL